MLASARALRPLRRTTRVLTEARRGLTAAEHQQKVVQTLVEGIGESAQKEVPWFMEQMPPAYFRQVAPARRLAHLRAITALSSQGLIIPEIQLRDTSGKGFTFMTPNRRREQGTGLEREDNLNHIVERQLESLPAHLVLNRVLLFQSADGRLGLNVFDTHDESASGAASQLYHGDAVAASNEATLSAEKAAVTNIREYARKMEADDGFAFSEAKQSDDDLLGAHGLGDGGSSGDGRAKAALTLDDFLQRCPSSYVIAHGQTPKLFYKQMQLFRSVSGGDDMAVTLERYEDKAEHGAEGGALLTLAIPQSTARKAILRAILLLNLHGMELQRAQVDTIKDGPNETNVNSGSGSGGGFTSDVTLLRCVIKPTSSGESGGISGGSGGWDGGAALVRDAARLKWVSDWSFSLANSSASIAGPQKLSLLEAEVALGLADLSLSLLDHPLLSRKHVRERLHSPDVQPIAAKISRELIARFEPDESLRTSEGDFNQALSQVAKEIETGALSDEESKQLLRAMLSACKHTLRTNVHVDGRWALSMRLDPRFFEPVLPQAREGGFSNLPYGTFFVAGRHFNGYHNRFRDISRGGLRVVLPPSEEAHSAESRRHFMECYGLSWAQQLKNKDIPEGGSKGVVLVTPQPAEDRFELMHGCVKRMADAMLDLIVPETADLIVTRARDHASSDDQQQQLLGEELIYLGPDENITPRDLDWIVARAEQRGYAMPSAFMSSKPRAGINHKEYGVTSEGVAVFLREALKAIDIRPEQEPWTIKLTGGPDGDVAGNMLKILHRDYGENVRVVGLADGTACAEDPDGLPMDDLLRLFREGLPIAELDEKRLGQQGVLTLANTPEGVALRNTMHNRVVADAFVPAGGRPATMNSSNWADFLLPDGKTPSAKVIVEGANLFLTPEARLNLFERCGLPVVKDSSANKCGVICSSMEIRASMCVSDDDFVAFKSEYVEDVLSRLREMAHLEASLLFAEAARDASTPLPALSERISFAILRVADALSTVMDSYARTTELWPLVSSQLPETLANSAVHAPSLPEKLPWEYQKSTIVKSLASRLVYREGLAFVEGMPDQRLPAFALAYLEQEQHVRGLAGAVAKSGQPFAPEVEALLLRGGVRVAAEVAANHHAASVNGVNGSVNGVGH